MSSHVSARSGEERDTHPSPHQLQTPTHRRQSLRDAGHKETKSSGPPKVSYTESIITTSEDLDMSEDGVDPIGEPGNNRITAHVGDRSNRTIKPYPKRQPLPATGLVGTEDKGLQQNMGNRMAYV